MVVYYYYNIWKSFNSQDLKVNYPCCLLFISLSIIKRKYCGSDKVGARPPEIQIGWRELLLLPAAILETVFSLTSMKP